MRDPHVRGLFYFVINSWANRPYTPSLFRLLIRKLTTRKRFTVMQTILRDLIHQKANPMNQENLIALVNYAVRISPRPLARVMKAAEEMRSQTSSGQPSVKTRALVDTAESSADPARAPVDPRTEGISTSEMDAQIQAAAAEHMISRAIRLVENLSKQHNVPTAESIDAILHSLILMRDQPSTQPLPIPAPVSSSRQAALSTAPSRQYSTATDGVEFTSTVPEPRDDIITVRLNNGHAVVTATTPDFGEYVSSVRQWPSRPRQPTDSKEIWGDYLLRLLPYMNRHNIRDSTILRLADLCKTEALLDLPWKIAERAEKPKSLLRQHSVQAALVEAACTTPTKHTQRHFRLSRAPLVLMKFEGMGIPPCRHATIYAIMASLKEGNIPAVMAMTDRLLQSGQTLRSREAVRLLELVQPSEAEKVTSVTGQELSDSYIRGERLDLVLYLRRFITDKSDLGSYVRALSLFGASADIREEFEQLNIYNAQEKEVNDGVILMIVESLVATGDVWNAFDVAEIASYCKYPFTYSLARAIAKAVRLGQRRLGHELLMLVVKRGVMNEGEVKQVLFTMLEAQGISVGEPWSERAQFVERVGEELNGLMIMVREEADVVEAHSEVERLIEERFSSQK